MKAFFTLIFLIPTLACWSQAPNADCPNLVNLGPDITVCNDAIFTLNPNPLPDVQYAWIGSGFLSCTDCPSPVVSGLNTGIYTYIVVATTPICTENDTIQIIVFNGQQPQYVIGEDKAICIGASVNLGGEAGPGSFYNWTSVPGGFTSTIADPVATPTQSTTYYLEVQNGSCPVSSFDSIKIAVYNPPVLKIQSDTAICNGQSVQLASSIVQPEVVYTWTPNAGALSDSTLANPIATPPQTTLYTLNANNPGCSVTEDVLVAVVNLEFNLSIGDSILICKGAALTVAASANPLTNVGWSPLVDIQILNNGQTAILKPQESTQYTATASLPGCVRKAQLYIRVDSLPSNLAIYPADTTVCIGSQVILKSETYEPSDFPSIEFEWSPSSGQLTPDTLYNMVLSPVDTILYQRITRSGACTDTAFALVNVVKPPQITVTPPSSVICPGTQVQLNAVIPAGVEDIQWTPMNTSISCTDCANPIVTPSNTTTYQISGMFNGCPTGASAEVVVRTPPILKTPVDLNLCSGASILLNEINDPSATYLWTSTDPAFGTVTAAQPLVVPTLPNTTYFVTANNGCVTTAQITVKVNSATLMTAGTATICEGSSTLISASTSVPGSFLWSNGATQQSINVMPSQTTTYKVSFSYGDGCTLTDSVKITVQGQNASAVFPADLELCPGESIQLNSLVIPGASYQWTSDPAGLTTSDPTPTVQPDPGTTTYYLTTTLGICTKTDSVKVIVYTASLSLPSDTTICGGSDLRISASANATGDYLWSNGEMGAQLSIDSIIKSGIYNVLFTYGSSNAICTLTESIVISVKPSFNLNIIADPAKDVYNLGENIDLTAIVSPTMSLNGFNFVWKKNGQQVNGSTDMISVVTDVSLTDTAILTYTITATSPNGCSRTTEKRLVLLPPVVRVPNVFTPNGDDLNDTFGLKIISGVVRIDNFVIFNRWGQKVYESKEQNATWDGKIGENDAPSDVYVFRITWRDGSGALRKPEEGQVTLLR